MLQHPSEPFSYRDGIRRGLGRGALAGPRFVTPFHGVRVAADGASPHPVPVTPHELILLRCRQYAPRLRSGQFFSHTTALALLGAPLPRRAEDVLHVSTHRPAYPPRTPGARGHRLQTREPDLREVADLPVEHPARAWVQASSEWTRDELVAAGDYLIGRLGPRLPFDEIRAEAHRMRGTALDPVLADIRYGSESPEETRLRLVLDRAGLPEPELNGDLRGEDGRFIARLDQLHRRFRVGVEYDGRQHAMDVRQFRKDADRWDAIRDAGWQLVRILDHHLHPHPDIAVQKVRNALLSAGWRPPLS